MGHTSSSALFEESTANKMNNTRTDASTTFSASSPTTDLRSDKVAPFGCGPNASVLRTSASGSSMTEPTKIPMKATIVESLRTEGEPPSEPPSVVKGCETPDDFGRRRFEQMGLIPLHQLDWIKFKMVVDDQTSQVDKERLPPAKLGVEDLQDASTTFTASSPNATVLRTSALGSSSSL